MLKSQRDQLISSLTPEERQDFRDIIGKIKVERKARGITAREVAESHAGEYSPKVGQALEGTLVRDETGPRVGQEPQIGRAHV